MTEDTDRRWHESPEYRQEQLSAALDGMLTPDERAALDAHLAGCASCRRELEELRQVRSLLRAVPEPALPRSFLLPLEGDLPAPHATQSPRPPIAPRTPASVTPLRQPERRERVGARATRTLQVTRWIGTIAAILGLALFLGTLLPLATHQNASYSASAPNDSRGAPTGAGASASTTKAPSPTSALTDHGKPQVAVTVTATATAAVETPTESTATPAAAPAANHFWGLEGPSLADYLRVAALVLLVLGAAVAIVSLVLARRV
jgi:anti-sigma factor RsiW